MSIECKHGYLARTCDQCEADAEIARLTRERDEAHQALEAERARVAELRELIHILLNNDPDDSAGDGVTVLDVWRKHARRALAAEGGEG